MRYGLSETWEYLMRHIGEMEEREGVERKEGKLKKWMSCRDEG